MLEEPCVFSPPPDHVLKVDLKDAHWGFSTCLELVCKHADDDPSWWSLGEDGSVSSHDCWFYSWWDGIGAEILAGDGWPENPRFPVPVRPSDDWDYENGGTIVYAPPMTYNEWFESPLSKPELDWFDHQPVGVIGPPMRPRWIKVANGVEPYESQGQALSREEYPVLYSIIGDIYGGEGVEFRIPDLRLVSVLRRVTVD